MRPRARGVRLAIEAWIAAGLLMSAQPAGALDPVPLTACGQSVTGDVALTANLDCAGSPDPGVRLGHTSTLDLQGFTLSGGGGDGVICEGRCSVISSVPGGTISGFAGHGMARSK